MTAILNLPPQVEKAYLAEAQARGLSIEDLVRDVLVARQPFPVPNHLSPDEWLREFEVWVQSHAGNSVVLPDSAMERESIYDDRGQ